MSIGKEDPKNEEIKKLNVYSDADSANVLNAVLLSYLIQCERDHSIRVTKSIYTSTAAVDDISRGYPSGRGVGGVSGGGCDGQNGGGEHGEYGGGGGNGGSGKGSDGEGGGGKEGCGGKEGGGRESSGVSGRSGGGGGGRRVWRGVKREKSPEKHKSSHGLPSSSSM